ncbi:MAG: RNA polymerase sigma factor [Actinomycetota bacterium]
MSEGTLSDRLAEDLDGAFAALVTELRNDVFTAALRWSGNRTAAEDIAQETFLRAYSALGRYDAARVRELHLRAWLLTIALNVFRNELRSASRRPATQPLGGGELLVVDRSRSADDLASTIVLALPEEQRVPVVLRHVLGLSYEEIAEILGRPEGTVKAQAARGIRRLRDSLTDDEPERAEVRK